MNGSRLFVFSSALSLALACASTPPPASQNGASTAPPATVEPEPEPAPAAADVTPQAPAAREEANEAESAPAPVAESEPSPPSEEEKPSTSPLAVLTGAEVAFIIDYARSAPRSADEKACEAEAQGDLAARAACMSKARDAFQADVLRFKKDAGGKWWLYTYKRKGQSLSEVHSMLVDFADESERSVVVKAKGREQGTRVLFKGANSLFVNVPNDYSIRLEDPKLGLLVYDAKVGLVGK